MDMDEARKLITPCPMCGRIALHDTGPQEVNVAIMRLRRHIVTMAIICAVFSFTALTAQFITAVL